MADELAECRRPSRCDGDGREVLWVGYPPSRMVVDCDCERGKQLRARATLSSNPSEEVGE